MRIIYGPAGSGKTTQLIKIAAKHDYYMVVKSAAEARRVKHEAIKLGYDILFPLTYREFLDNKYYKSGIKGFLIDNADMMLQELSEGKLAGYSYTTVKKS